MTASTERNKMNETSTCAPNHIAQTISVSIERKPNFLMQFFTYSHLPESYQAISKPFCDLAEIIDSGPSNPEATVALRKLLEAKDCAVRASLVSDAPKSKAVTINGVPFNIANPHLSYENIAIAAGINPERNPSVMASYLPSTKIASVGLISGESLLVREDMHITCLVTDNA